jgi:SAM-dependent methyltransferase
MSNGAMVGKENYYLGRMEGITDSARCFSVSTGVTDLLIVALMPSQVQSYTGLQFVHLDSENFTYINFDHASNINICVIDRGIFPDGAIEVRLAGSLQGSEEIKSVGVVRENARDGASMTAALFMLKTIIDLEQSKTRDLIAALKKEIGRDSAYQAPNRAGILLDGHVPVPALTNIARIAGGFVSDFRHNQSSLIETFRNEGADHVRCINKITQTYTGKGLDSIGSILDWGCGCGRMARHLPIEARDKFVGVYIDPINIRWCRENLPFGSYILIDINPPTPFDAGTFDLIYSHSVLTHLNENNQDKWLREIARICRGIAILSVHSHYSESMNSWCEDIDMLTRFLDRGFVCTEKANKDLEEEFGDYYTDSAYTHGHIRTHWSKYLEVMDIIPAGFGGLHDAVVCRPVH